MAYCPVCQSYDLTHYRENHSGKCKETGQDVRFEIVTCKRDILPSPRPGLPPLPRHWLVYRCPGCGVTFDAIDQGCFVATAIYGSSSAPEVIALRTFRDLYLSRSNAGRAFIRAYYSWLSAVLLKIVSPHRSMRHLAKFLLDNIVHTTQRKYL